MKFTRKTFAAQPYIYVEKTTDYVRIAEAMGAAFGTVFGFVGQHGITPQSMPMTVYLDMPKGSQLSFRSGVLVSPEDAARARGDIKADTLPAGDAMTATHVGPYASLNQSHGALWKHLEDTGIASSMPVWEIYTDDPDKVDEARLRTKIHRKIAG